MPRGQSEHARSLAIKTGHSIEGWKSNRLWQIFSFFIQISPEIFMGISNFLTMCQNTKIPIVGKLHTENV